MFEIKTQLPSKKLILIGLPLLVISCMATIGILYRLDHTRITRETVAPPGYMHTERSRDASSIVAATSTGQHGGTQSSSSGQQGVKANQASNSAPVASGHSGPSLSTATRPEVTAQPAPTLAPSSQTTLGASSSTNQLAKKPTSPTSSSSPTTSSSPKELATDQAPKQQTQAATNTCSISLLGLCVSLGL